MCTGAGMFGNPREYRCQGGGGVQLEALCDGFRNCTIGDDERAIICESKLYPNSPFGQKPDSGYHTLNFVEII